MLVNNTVSVVENSSTSWVSSGEVRVTNIGSIVSESPFSFDYFLVDNKVETVLSLEIKLNNKGSKNEKSLSMLSVKPDMTIVSSRCELESFFPTELELTYHELSPIRETSIVIDRATRNRLRLSDIILETGIAKVNPAKIDEFDRIAQLFMEDISSNLVEELKSAISCVNSELIKTGKKNNSDYKIEIDLSIDPEVTSWTNFPIVVKLKEEKIEMLLELWEFLNIKCCSNKTLKNLFFVDVVFWD